MPELLELYSQYDVFAFPTREREPFGLVPLEAARAGLRPDHDAGSRQWPNGLSMASTVSSPRGPPRHSPASSGRLLEGRIDARADRPRVAEITAWRDFHLDAILPRIERKLAAAARQSRAGAGTAAEAYRMARMAEQLTQVLLQEEEEPEQT